MGWRVGDKIKKSIYQGWEGDLKWVLADGRARVIWRWWEVEAVGIGMGIGVFCLLHQIFSNQVQHSIKKLDPIGSHSNYVTSSKWVDTLICHTTMHRNSINFPYNPGHMTFWCLEVVLVVYAKVQCDLRLCKNEVSKRFKINEKGVNLIKTRRLLIQNA